MTSRTAAAEMSAGPSTASMLGMVVRLVRARTELAEHLVDVGCGRGDLYPALHGQFRSYTVCDLVRYEGLPESPHSRFLAADLNDSIPLADASADLVVSVETIEHLENPRAFMRSSSGSPALVAASS
jgi:2-polyprenyl-3-methyl-5-hydroxy-6-metoxy-1,4-benzoquinol methylase